MLERTTPSQHTASGGWSVAAAATASASTSACPSCRPLRRSPVCAACSVKHETPLFSCTCARAALSSVRACHKLKGSSSPACLNSSIIPTAQAIPGKTSRQLRPRFLRLSHHYFAESAAQTTPILLRNSVTALLNYRSTMCPHRHDVHHAAVSEIQSVSDSHCTPVLPVSSLLMLSALYSDENLC